MNLFAVLLICTGFDKVLTDQIIPPNSTEQYLHSTKLQSEYILYWKIKNETITFEIHARTLGWVGLGISHTGGMANADIFVGWVKEETVYITDRHGTNVNGFPPLDQNQNLEILMGSEINTWTILKFRRNLRTCDNNQDITITADTFKVIWATGMKDPTENIFSPDDYHFTNKGAQNLFFLNSPRQQIKLDNVTYKPMDFQFEPTLLPPLKTYYACTLFAVPSLPFKHHVVQMEPIFGNVDSIKYAHHMLGYQCEDVLEDPSIVGKSVECYTPQPTDDILKCRLLISAWAMGGGPFVFPPNVGMSLGEPGDTKHFRLEIHYNNPEKISGIVDTSGWRFIYTSQLREFDSGAMLTGHFVSPLHMIIPPNANSFPVYGDCSASCLHCAMQELNITTLNIFAVGHHTHTVGSSIEVKHIRENVELKKISEDKHYDFSYQEIRYVNPIREIKVGDSIQVICRYTTNGIRTNITTGGLSTKEEMCLGVLFYYPRLKIGVCESSAQIPDILHYFGIRRHSYIGKFSIRSSWKEVHVKRTRTNEETDVWHLINGKTWNNQTALEFSEFLRNAKRLHFCSGIDNYQPNGYRRDSSAIYIQKPYHENNEMCNYTSDSFFTNISILSMPSRSDDILFQNKTNSSKTHVSPSLYLVFLCFVCLLINCVL